jgi:uncharacterized membrane-anchored protein YitT (DUF2179 family)
MPYRVDIYIGSDSKSRKISKGYLSKVEKWASAIFPNGYTLLKGRGYYNGASEDSVIVNVFTDRLPDLNSQLELLKRKLMQDAILLVRSPVEFEVV